MTKRIRNIEGIHNAYQKAADISETEYFYIVDADNEIFKTFKFDFNPTTYDFNTFVWQAKNPVNELTYGYGGIKLYKRSTFYGLNTNQYMPQDQNSFLSIYDFPICNPVAFVNEVASITRFNSSEFDAWKAAFRECCKLISFGKYLNLTDKRLQNDLERLHIWLTVGESKPFGKWVIKGANEGKQFGIANLDNLNELANINNFNWLKDRFKNTHPNVFT